MKFIVTSRDCISRLDGILVEPTTGRMYKIDEPFIVIAVKDVGFEDSIIPQHDLCRGILRLEFHDCDKKGEKFAGVSLVAIEPEDGKRIVDFYRDHYQKVGLIVTQCEAGISRSAAIAAALSKLIDDDDERFFKEFHPNRLVYRTIIKAAIDPL